MPVKAMKMTLDLRKSAFFDAENRNFALSKGIVVKEMALFCFFIAFWLTNA